MLFRSGARKGFAPLALQGVWTSDNGKFPDWRGDYHNDLNTQMSYWGAGPAGHIEVLEGFADFYIERLPEFRKYCRKLFGDDADGAAIPGTMGYGGNFIPGWAGYNVPPIGGLWAFLTFCDAWDYDPTREKAAKYLAFGRELAKGIEHACSIEGGVRKFAVSCSPETYANGPGSFMLPNTSYDRDIATSFFLHLARLAEACGENAEATRWREVAATFGPANTNGDGVLELAAGKLQFSSHRHPSHLMSVFPLVDVPHDARVDAAKSVDQWEELGEKGWCGYSYSWAACFEARLGRGDRALRYLDEFCRSRISRNGFHLNNDQSKGRARQFTLEGNFGFARAVQEMLLSYDPHADEVVLFPALSSEWNGKEVSFRNLRIPGGHRVSATRSADGIVTYTLAPNPAAKTVPRCRNAAVSSPVDDCAPAAIFNRDSVVLFVGDSITDGGRRGDMNHYLGHGYASEIAMRYLGYRPKKNLCFLNCGISGNSTKSLLERWDRDVLHVKPSASGWEGVFPGRTGELKPDVVSILVGINDYLSSKPGNRTSPDEFAKNLETLVVRTHEALPACTVVVCEPFRIPEDTSPDFIARQNAVRDIARRHGCCFVDFQRLFSDVLIKENPNAKYWMWDRVHPTYAAHIRMADYWIEKFREGMSR